METSKWEGTKERIVDGQWSWGSQGNCHQYDFEGRSKPTLKELEENVRLFHDAMVTIQECGMMPSKLLEIVKAKDRQLNESDKEIAEWEEENAKLKREIEEMNNKSLSIADKIEEHTGERSLTEVLESEEKLKEALIAANEYIEESPCDPDITIAQSKAWINWLNKSKDLL